MRSNKRILVSGLMAIGCIAVLLLAGCSSDNSTSTSITTDGSLTDPEFVVVQDQINTFVDSTISFFQNGVNTFNGISEDGTILPPQYAVSPGNPDAFDTSYADGWHRIRICMTNEELGYETTLLDSVQYRRNNQARENWEDRDQLVFKHRWTYGDLDTTVSYNCIDGNSNYTFSDLDTDEATITGNNNMHQYSYQVMADSTICRDMTIDANLHNFYIRHSSATGWCNCPTEGSMSGATFRMIYQKDSNVPDTTNWTFNLSFNNGTMTANVRMNNIVWNYTHQACLISQ